MAEIVPVNCVYCSGAAFLQFIEGTVSKHPDGSTDRNVGNPVRWVCPHRHKENMAEYPGRLAWVMKRVEGSGTRH